MACLLLKYVIIIFSDLATLNMQQTVQFPYIVCFRFEQKRVATGPLRSTLLIYICQSKFL